MYIYSDDSFFFSIVVVCLKLSLYSAMMTLNNSANEISSIRLLLPVKLCNTLLLVLAPIQII